MCDIGQFKADLLRLDTSAIIQSYICSDDCAILSTAQQLRSKAPVADKFVEAKLFNFASLDTKFEEPKK